MPAGLKPALDAIGWNMRKLAHELGCSHTLIQKWEDGRLDIPRKVSDWLELYRKFHERHPAPTDWRRK